MEAAFYLSRSPAEPQLGELIGFAAAPARHRERHPAEDLLRNSVAALEELLGGLVTKRSALEFRMGRDAMLPTYWQVMAGTAQVVQLLMPREEVEHIVAESLTELEAGLRDHGEAMLGNAVKDQALFTVWTLRKMAAVAQKIAARPISGELLETDRALSRNYLAAAVWARFHLDCVVRSMRLNQPLFPEVLEEVSRGMESIVPAFAAIREAADLRFPRPQIEEDIVPSWDEEDQTLLDASMDDAPVV